MELRLICFILVFSIVSLYINEWNYNLTWLLSVAISAWIFKQGISTKAIRKRFYQWILEQKQNRNVPIVQKCNVFGQSAEEIGTIHTQSDLQLEQPLKNGGDSIFLHMSDEHGSWLILKLNLLENQNLAKIDLIWGHQVRIQ